VQFPRGSTPRLLDRDPVALGGTNAGHDKPIVTFKIEFVSIVQAHYDFTRNKLQHNVCIGLW